MSLTSVIKKELYTRVRQEVLERVGRQDPEIQKLERAMHRFQKKNWKPISSISFEKVISSTPLVFWGDFHGVRQYQRTLLRWLEMRDFTNPKSFCLALECLPSSKQVILDQYLNHTLSESEFLTQVQWKKNWGFPWEHYKPLFDLAKEKGFSILALNSNQPNSGLKTREMKAMRLIQGFQKANPKAQIWALYGEYHLLPKHFPKLLRSKKDQCAYVLQNAEELYFSKPPKRQKEFNLFRLENNFYCQQSVAPWIKWQSYLLFLETSENVEFDEGIDVSDHMTPLCQSLAHELGWAFKAEEMSILGSDEPQLWNQLKTSLGPEKRLFETLIQEGFSFVSNHRTWSYLARLTVNEMGSLAFMNLWFQNNPLLFWPSRNQWKFQDWQHFIWMMSFCYFGTKVLNPHRKTPALADLQNLTRAGYQPFERQAARLVINYWLQRSLKRSENIFDATPSDRVRFLAVTWIAGLQGERIYSAYEQKRLTLNSLKAFLAKDPGQIHFNEVEESLDELLLTGDDQP